MSLPLWPLFEAVVEAVGATGDDRPAVLWRGRRISYGELHGRSARFSALLAAHGIGWHRSRAELVPWEAGQDLVATYLLNCPEYLEVTFGGFGARAAPFNVNYRYVDDELAYLLRDADAAAVVFHGAFADRLARVLPELDRSPLLVQVDDGSGASLLPGALDYEAALGEVSAQAAVGHDPDDLYVVYTGGTTGMPKSTLWRQGDIWMAALGGDLHAEGSLAAVAAAAAAATGPRFLPNAPFMHAAAHWTAVRTILHGGTVVVNDVNDRLDPHDVWRLVEQERVDMMLMVGEAFARPLLEALATSGRDASTLRVAIVGGAATSLETKQRLVEALPGVLVVDGAGSSETGTALSAYSSAGRMGEAAVFSPTAGVVVLRDDLGALAEPGHEAPGWFAKRGPIPLGYLGDEAKTAATFPVIDGVRYSVPGDRARLRADGTIQLLGRDSVTINTGGEKVFAEEVEAALLRHPEVVDAVVVGRPSERWGQEVVAVVALASPVSDADLSAIAGERLARYKLPKVYVRVREVVRSPAGKADYRWAQAAASGGGEV